MNALELVDVAVSLGGRNVVAGVTVAFARDRVHAVVGRSGAGKSVLMKAVAGLLPTSHGEVRVLAAPLVFVHQDPALLDTLDVRENIAFPVSRSPGKTQAQVDQAVDAAIASLGLGDVVTRAPSSLSPAVQKRVSIARALCLKPGVLVIDEPTTGLDPVAAQQVDETLASLASAGTTLIVITHSPRTLKRLRPDVVVVEGGTAHRRAAA